MDRLSLDTFLSGTHDMEAKQYLVLQRLKGYYDEFSHNRLYPGLGDLIQLVSLFDDLIQKKTDLQGLLPQRLKELDIENQRLVYEPVQGGDDEFNKAMELILWALPHLKKAIEEGMDIYNFVDEHVVIEEVGILPVYREEGYWFVPDMKVSRLHLLRYEVSLFSASSERFRTLKTRLLESLELVLVRRSPESIKLELMQKYHDLPNPATYVCETDLDFPYIETILPIAKRKFMTHLFS
jgi:hypothetical protein